MEVPNNKVLLDKGLFKQMTQDVEMYRKESGMAKAFIAEKLKWDEFVAWRVVKRMEKA